MLASRLWLVALWGVVLGVRPGVADVLLTGPELVRALRAGGYVIYVRHTATDWSQTDRDLQHAERCDMQRNLSDDGRAQAREIGTAFQQLRVPVGQVLASPLCRTLDTARLAFGRAEPSDDLLVTASAHNAADRQRIERLKQLLATPPGSGTNDVLVSHNWNLEAAANISLVQGEAVIFQPTPSGFKLVARLRPEQWRSLIQAAP
jgi:phosphohistidine phosphatase SixA